MNTCPVPPTALCAYDCRTPLVSDLLLCQMVGRAAVEHNAKELQTLTDDLRRAKDQFKFEYDKV